MTLPERPAPVYIVMGVCGCGKSTVAAAFANAIGAEMLDADDFHPDVNLRKMSKGIALDDEDRADWLARLNEELLLRQSKGRSAVLACSALKRRYRERIERGLGACHWIYLKGTREIIRRRMAQRRDHFMPLTLIDSQLDTLEEPENAEVVDIEQSLEAIQRQLLKRFSVSGEKAAGA